MTRFPAGSSELKWLISRTMQISQKCVYRDDGITKMNWPLWMELPPRKNLENQNTISAERIVAAQINLHWFHVSLTQTQVLAT